MAQVRLNKHLAQCGIASRRAAEKIISEGRVSVNGTTVSDQGVIVDPNKDTIRVDGKPIRKEKLYYFILNKPKFYLCTASPCRSRVIDLFHTIDARLFTVGRLDKETTGLIIVTNDGDFANRIIHPSSSIEKEYLVKTNRDLSAANLKRLSIGITVQRSFVKPSKVIKVRRGTLRISVMEGKKHEVRTLIEGIGANVLSLKRIRIGNLTLGTIPEGSFRPMTEREKELIFE